MTPLINSFRIYYPQSVELDTPLELQQAVQALGIIPADVRIEYQDGDVWQDVPEDVRQAAVEWWREQG